MRRCSDNVNIHVDARMRALIDTRPWLTVFYLPTYAPDLNPVEMVWSPQTRRSRPKPERAPGGP
jgi:transposase